MVWGEHEGQLIDSSDTKWGLTQHVRDMPHEEKARAVAEMSACDRAALPAPGPDRASVFNLPGRLTFGDADTVGARTRRMFEGFSTHTRTPAGTSSTPRSNKQRGERVHPGRAPPKVAADGTWCRRRAGVTGQMDPRTARRTTQEPRPGLDTSLRHLRTDYVDLHVGAPLGCAHPHRRNHADADPMTSCTTARSSTSVSRTRPVGSRRGRDIRRPARLDPWSRCRRRAASSTATSNRSCWQ